VPPRPWRQRIEDILGAIERIETYIRGMTFDSFSADQRTIDAVVRNLEIVGEASRHIPDEVVARYASLPWAEMRAMRNILSHAYFLVDIDIVWKTIRDDLPGIEPMLRQMLEENP